MPKQNVHNDLLAKKQGVKVALLLLATWSTLSFATEVTKATCLTALEKVAKTQAQRAEYETFKKDHLWKKWMDDETDHRRFIAKNFYKENAGKTHPVSLYGAKNYLAWRNAADFVNEIPLGQFNLSIELFSRIHEISSKALNPLLKKFSFLIPEGYLPSKAGVLKKRPSFGRDPLFESLTEEEYQALKGNPWLSGFVEIPWLSKPNQRRGFIKYATAAETPAKLEKLIQWYNENKDTMDPVELAARFQQAFVSIHPFIDGNGRTSRLLMDRILAEHGLPPPLLESQSDDIYMTPEAYTEMVRSGIDEYLAVEKSLGGGRFYQIAPAVNRRANYERTGFGFRAPGDSKTRAKPHRYMSIDNWGTPEIFLGGKPFILMQDGFFYSPKGIPHVYHEGTLYPITDQSYGLYMARNASLGKAGKLANSQRVVYRSHFGLMREIDSGRVDPSKISVVAYDAIQLANDSDRLQLYEWQKPAFLEAVTIRATDPIAVLSGNKIPQTDFEKQNAFGISSKRVVPQTLAQYEAMDLTFWKHMEYAKTHFPEAVPEIMKSREKLWSAGRQLIQDFIKERNKLTKKDRDLLLKSSAYHLWDSYLGRSKLACDTFSEAMNKTDDSQIMLLRSDSSSASFVGFRSQADYQRLIDSVPGSDKIRAYLKGLETYYRDPKNETEIKAAIKKWQDRASDYSKFTGFLPLELQKLSRDVDGTYSRFISLLAVVNSKALGSKYGYRGTSAEFQRAYVDFVLHASGGTASKEGTSFTTSLELLIPQGYSTSEALTYSSASPDSSLFLVKVPKSKVEWNYASGFSNEYEVIGMKPVLPWAIQKRYRSAELYKGLPEGISEEAHQFIKKNGIGITLSNSQTAELKALAELSAEAQKEWQAVNDDPASTPEQKAKAQEICYKKQQEISEKNSSILYPPNKPSA